MIRVLLLLPLLAALGWWLNREQQAGRFQRVDEQFLDFLVANARDRFEKAEAPANAASQVVLVKMRTADKAEYAGWPPRPLDWQMVLKGLQPYDPAVVVIPETLMWGRPPPEFVREAAEAFVPFPSTVLGIEGRLAPNADAPAFLGGLEEVLPRFQKGKVHGEINTVPALGALVAAPDDLLRRQADVGVTIARHEDDTTWLPYALQEGGVLRPSVLAQAMTHVTGTPYATHRLLLGAGAGAYLANGAFVPLSPRGEWLVHAQTQVPEVDALNLMTVEMADALSPQDRQLLGPGKVVVIGTDESPAGGLARQHAQALTRILAMPRIHLLPPAAEWAVWGLAALAGCALVCFVPKRKALLRGGLIIFLGLAACFVVFQSRLVWCPPTLPVALLVAATLFTRIAGQKTRATSAEVSATTAATEPPQDG
ncbi:MAG: hypothetical protein ACO1TE_15940 [Prosthecobacter sp.]